MENDRGADSGQLARLLSPSTRFQQAWVAQVPNPPPCGPLLHPTPLLLHTTASPTRPPHTRDTKVDSAGSTSTSQAVTPHTTSAGPGRQREKQPDQTSRVPSSLRVPPSFRCECLLRRSVVRVQIRPPIDPASGMAAAARAAGALALALVLALARANSEGDALSALRRSLRDPGGVLQSWDPTLVNPCTWFHVTCNRVTRV